MNYMQGFPALQGVGQAPNFGNPEQLAQALQMFKGGQNTLTNAATVGNPQAQAQQQESLAAMMEAYKRAQGDQQWAQELQSPEYVQNSGALGALAMIVQANKGRRLQKQADETASQYAERIFAEQQKQEQAQAEAEARAQEAAQSRLWAREDQRDATKAERERALVQLRIDEANRRAELGANARIRAAQISASGQGGGASVLSAEEARAIGLAPGTVAQRDRTGKVSILQAPTGQTPADPVAARDARAAAESAVEVLTRVSELQGLLDSGKDTGPLAQFFPGSDAQAFEATSDALNVASLRSRFGGNPTEGEREANRKTLPNLARNEDVNRRLIESERAAALRRIQAYNAMPGVTPIAIPDGVLPSGGANVDALLEKYR